MARRKSPVTSNHAHKPTVLEHIADALTNMFGTVTFLLANLLFFALWIVINLGWIHGIRAFDPYPFGLLTMIVSLEAIALSIIVLMSQNRASKRDAARERADYNVDLKAEKQIVEIGKKLDSVLKHVKPR